MAHVHTRKAAQKKFAMCGAEQLTFTKKIVPPD